MIAVSKNRRESRSIDDGYLETLTGDGLRRELIEWFDYRRDLTEEITLNKEELEDLEAILVQAKDQIKGEQRIGQIRRLLTELNTELDTTNTTIVWLRGRIADPVCRMQTRDRWEWSRAILSLVGYSSVLVLSWWLMGKFLNR